MSDPLKEWIPHGVWFTAKESAVYHVEDGEGVREIYLKYGDMIYIRGNVVASVERVEETDEDGV